MNKKEITVLSDVFPQIISFEQLERAYRKARKQKRYRNEILEFSSDLDENLLKIQRQLIDGSFRFGPYRRHWVYIPKRRLVMALPFPSRVVQWSIYLVLNPFYDKMMIEDSYACRVGKGSLAAVLRLQYWLRLLQNKSGNWYCLKMDISKYFYRIDHEVLLEILERRIKDKRFVDLLKEIIDSGEEKFGLPRFASPDDIDPCDWLCDVGMPIGNLTSQLFANIYLNELDQYCKHKLHIRFYIRYMDDVIILAESKEKAHCCWGEIKSFLNGKLHLDLNSKTSVRPVNLPIEFVGYSVTCDSLKLRKKSVKHLKSSFRNICSRYFAGELSEEDFKRRTASFCGIMDHVSNSGLRNRLNEIYLHEKEKRAL